MRIGAPRQAAFGAVVALTLALSGCGGVTPIPVAEPDDAPPPRATVTIQLTDAEADGVPRSNVELVVVHDRGEREVASVGMITGICTYDGVSPSGSLQQVRCWWQGEERVFRLRRTGDQVKVVGDVGDVLAELPLEASAEVEVPSAAP